MEKHTYIINLMAQTTYVIRANSEDEAVDYAYEHFAEYLPDCAVEIDDTEKPDVEI